MREVALSLELLEKYVKANFPDVFGFHLTCQPFGTNQDTCCQAWVDYLWEGEPAGGPIFSAATLRAALSNLCDELELGDGLQNLGGSDE